MNKARTVIGAHGFLFPEGVAFTSPTAGTAGRAAKPGNADAGWFDVGVSDWTFQPTSTIEDFFAPAPGIRVLWDKITTKKGLKLKGKLMEMSNVTWQMLLGTLALPLTGAAGQYNPLEGDPVLRAWLQLQQYNQANTLINTMDVFVAMNIPGDVQFGDKPVDVDVEADVLFSTLNTGTLA
jgi:hypothetical protein